ncbi:hypothetical protein EDB85DRAFT_1434717 [Lactarius pseudohatsudake]|nr:hypothetical protein EDB85DRAFT_1434717 [Lactarius pseudohatsudake]
MGEGVHRDGGPGHLHYAKPGPPSEPHPWAATISGRRGSVQPIRTVLGGRGHRDGGSPRPGALRGMPCEIGSHPPNHIPGLQPYRIEAHPLVSTVNHTIHVGEGGGASAVCALLKMPCKMGSPPRTTTPGEGIRACERVPPTQKGLQKENDSDLGHRSTRASRSEQACMCVPCN